MKTAIEQLIEKLTDRIGKSFQIAFEDILNEAKELEKQQIVDATCLGKYVNEDDKEIGEDYYKTTFNK